MKSKFNLNKILIISCIIIVQGILGFQFNFEYSLSFIPCLTLLNDNSNNNNNDYNDDSISNINSDVSNSQDNHSEPNNFSDNSLSESEKEKYKDYIDQGIKVTKNKDGSINLDYSEKNKDYDKESEALEIIKFISDKKLQQQSSSYETYTFEYKEDREYLENEFNNFLNKLEANKQYQVLKWADTTDYGLVSIGYQWLIDKNTDVEGLCDKFYFEIESFREKNYDIEDGDLVFLKYRAFEKKFKLLDIYSKKNPIKKINLDKNKLKENKINKEFISNKYLPFSINESAYGKLITSENNTKIYIYNGYRIKRTLINNQYEIEIYSKTGVLIGKVIDIPTQNGFIRKKNNLEIFFNSKNQYIKTNLNIKTPFIGGKTGEWALKENIITFDIETYVMPDGKTQIPYACGWYDGKDLEMKYLTDFNNPEKMILESFKGLMKWKYNGYNIYIHNLGGFDIFFLLRILKNNFDIRTIEKKNRILEVDIKCTLGNKNRKITLKLKDSILMLPRPLRELCNKFEVETRKGIFPYKFASFENLNYIGPKPDYKYYESDDLSLKEWEALEFNKNWNFKNESLAYLKSDLISLYEVLFKFNRLVFNKFSTNMTNFISLPSLAFFIYRTHYLKNHKIPIITGKLYSDIKESYYGGIVDVYKPILNNGYLYDINSLYPFAMLQDMPVGQPIYTTETDLNKIFGFVYVTVTTPKDLNIPVLPYKTEDGRLISPLGTWSGMYFSEELKQARDKFGYKIQVHWGYEFERGKEIFKNYVEDFYAIKSNPGSELQFIAKLLLNSLYGRFGMQEFKDAMEIVSSEKREEIMKTRKVLTEYELDSESSFIRYEIKPDKELCLASGTDYSKILMEQPSNFNKFNISIGISSAITAYARMHMNQFKHISNNACVYTDTDSVVLEKPLSDKFIGPEIGLMKLEHQFIRGLFIAPKLYYLEKVKGEPIVKSKGIKTKLTKEQFESLFAMRNLVLKEQRWVKDYKVGTIRIEDRNINIEFKVLKRNRIISQGKWIDTSPLIINDKVESLSLYGIGTIINLDSNLKLIYKDNDLKLITAPDYKLLPAPQGLEKGPIGTKSITGAGNLIDIKNKAHIDSLIDKLMELDNKIVDLNSKLKDYEPNSFNLKITETQLIIIKQERGAVLRELFILGLKDPYNYMLEIKEKADIICLPAPLPYVIYVNAPATTSLLALPVPNYKLLPSPNYKLLPTPQIEPNTPGYKDPVIQIKNLDLELSKLLKERDSRDYSSKDPNIQIKCMIKKYELKLFFLSNMDKLDENLINTLRNKDFIRPHDNDWVYFFNLALCDLKSIYKDKTINKSAFYEQLQIVIDYLNNLVQVLSYLEPENFDSIYGIRGYRINKNFNLYTNDLTKWMDSRWGAHSQDGDDGTFEEGSMIESKSKPKKLRPKVRSKKNQKK